METLMANNRPELAALAAMLLGGGLGGGRSRGGGFTLEDLLGGGTGRRMGMTLGGAVVIGPEGVQILSADEITGGGDRDGDDAVTDALKEVRTGMLGKRISECDFGDYVPGEYGWTELMGSDVPHFATTARNTDTDDDPLDVHVWTLANLEPDEGYSGTDRWLLWSLCPRARQSTCIPLKAADEARAKYLASILLDTMTGRLEDMEFATMIARGRPKKPSKRAKAEAGKPAAPAAEPPATDPQPSATAPAAAPLP
jgi:hypothetical protein